MESNYDFDLDAELVREEEFLADPDEYEREIRCNVCKGSGLEYVHDQETDCINCEGMGSFLIDS